MIITIVILCKTLNVNYVWNDKLPGVVVTMKIHPRNCCMLRLLPQCHPRYTTIQTANLKFSYHPRVEVCVCGMLHSPFVQSRVAMSRKLRREVHIVVMHCTVIDHGGPGRRVLYSSGKLWEATSYAQGSADINLVTLRVQMQPSLSDQSIALVLTTY